MGSFLISLAVTVCIYVTADVRKGLQRLGVQRVDRGFRLRAKIWIAVWVQDQEEKGGHEEFRGREDQ